MDEAPAEDWTDRIETEYDVAVVGGSAAGLSGALMLARARRRVVVIDAGEPRNAPAHKVHGLLAREGMAPAELVARGRTEVRQYGGHVASGRVDSVNHAGRDGAGFALRLADGGSLRARRLLVATGVVDRLPDVPGLGERWGRDVVHCPYCHGWEIRDHAIVVLGTGPMAVHQALLFRQWSDDVVLVAHDLPAPLSDGDTERVAARGIRVVDQRAVALEIEDDRLAGVRLGDGDVVPGEAVAVQSVMEPRVEFLAPLGLEPAAHPSGMGRHLAVDTAGRTDVPGVWAAGNVADLAAQVGASAAAGAWAAAQINADLIEEETAAAVAAKREAAAY